MQRELFDEIEIKTPDGDIDTLKLRYYLITDNIREEYCDLKVYGIEIDSESVYSGGVCENDCKLIKNLFFRYSEAVNFLQKMIDNTVTPIGLKPAISEHIGEQIKLFNK